MTTLYKLTEYNHYTQKLTKWGENVTHSVSIEGTSLCTNQVIHVYEHPVIAVLLNPIHADFSSPVLWLAEGEIIARQGQVTCGVKKLTTIKQIPLPMLTIEQRIKIAILCALQIYKNTSFMGWATRWIAGTNRSVYSARGAAHDAAYTGGIFDNSNIAAAYAAYAARDAARDVACIANAIVFAARAIAFAATCHIKFDLIEIINGVMPESTVKTNEI